MLEIVRNFDNIHITYLKHFFVVVTTLILFGNVTEKWWMYYWQNNLYGCIIFDNKTTIASEYTSSTGKILCFFYDKNTSFIYTYIIFIKLLISISKLFISSICIFSKKEGCVVARHFERYRPFFIKKNNINEQFHNLGEIN